MISHYDAFLSLLAKVETGNVKQTGANKVEDHYQYIENVRERDGRIGKYQMRAEVLRDLEYYAFAKTEKIGETHGRDGGWGKGRSPLLMIF